MPNPFKCVVTDLPQVFVCTCWALGTVTEDVLHCLFLLPTGTISIDSKDTAVKNSERLPCDYLVMVFTLGVRDYPDEALPCIRLTTGYISSIIVYTGSDVLVKLHMPYGV